MSSNGAGKAPSPPAETEAPAETPKRGRGRPRKTPQEPTGPPAPKRPRGRPRGSKNKGPRAITKKAEPVGEKRPRGRPRKWPQKVVEEEGGQGEAEEAMEGPSHALDPEEEEEGE